MILHLFAFLLNLSIGIWTLGEAPNGTIDWPQFDYRFE